MGGRMEGTKELITTDAIRSKVYILRGQQVMLDQSDYRDSNHSSGKLYCEVTYK